MPPIFNDLCAAGDAGRQAYRRMFMKRRLAKITVTIIVVLFFATCYLAFSIYSYRNTDSGLTADAAIVLGAAVWSNRPSPVFRERINHAINLYQSGRVRKIIFTGGQGNSNEPTESASAKQYALQHGVKEADILLESKSHNTYENLCFAKRIANKYKLARILIVSDPLHMRRAVLMARDTGIEAYPSPTQTSRYKTLSSQIGFLAYETYYYTGYLLGRSLGVRCK